MSKAGKLLGNIHGPEGPFFYVNSATGNRTHDTIDEDITGWGGRVTLPKDLVESKAIIGNVNIRLNIEEVSEQLRGKRYSRSSCFTVLAKMKPYMWRGVPYVYPEQIYRTVKAHIAESKEGTRKGLRNLAMRINPPNNIIEDV